ncbi:MAG: prepilin-type N-terminal cleavage/methylation domain-containing protein [Fibrobacteres bacterium]|nr:prepilin-type N-terminal cleavage/methylation domain-containing protein [Fibrobacterota bacterium]
MNEKGYTILEALIGLLVISILSMPIYKLLTTEKKLTAEAKFKATAYFLALNEMELIKCSPISSLQNIEDDIETNGRNFHLIRIVAPRFPDELENPIKEITVKVLLKDRKLAELKSVTGGVEYETPEK